MIALNQMNTWREFRSIKGKKTLIWKVRQLNDTYETMSGYLDGAMQTFSDTPGDKGKVGTKAYVDPVANCTWSIEREIRKKEEHGYSEFINGQLVKVAVINIDFNKCLPKNFTGSKPQTDIKPEALEKLHKAGRTRYTRKYDGQCHLAVHHPWGWEIYTRRMDLATDRFPNHVKYLLTTGFEQGTILIGEMLCSQPDGTDDFKSISRICRSLPDEARKLVDNKECPEPTYQVFDIIFYNGLDLAQKTYDERRSLLQSVLSNKELVQLVARHNVTPSSWEEVAKNNNWEGFVVTDGSSIPGEKFYSFDGDAKRPLGHHKLKPTYTSDCIIFAGTKGTGKRGNGIGAIFMKQRHPETKLFINIGKCGSGFTEESLEELETLFKKYNIPILEKDKDADKLDLEKNDTLVCEIEYGSRQPGTNKFRFPVFLRLRYDKAPEECFIEKLAAEEE